MMDKNTDKQKQFLVSYKINTEICFTITTKMPGLSFIFQFQIILIILIKTQFMTYQSLFLWHKSWQNYNLIKNCFESQLKRK